MEPDPAARRPTGVRAVVVTLLLTATTVGCGGPRACTLMDVAEGVTVAWPAEERLRQGFVALEVCDDTGCEEVRQSTGQVRRGSPPMTSWHVGFAALGREFDPGTVSATAEVMDRNGASVAAGSDEVELTTTHPNGEECDGDGFVVGTMTLDAVGPRD